MGATSNGCEICGRLLPPVRFTETETYSYLCQDCADTEDVKDWGDVIPVCGEVGPAECADYPTSPAQVAEDEADFCECGHEIYAHGPEGCTGWIEDARSCPCARTDRLFKQARGVAGDEEALYQRANSVWGGFADQDKRARRDALARQDAARARRTAAAVFEADNGRAEWQPSTGAKQLIKESQGG